MAGRRKLPVPLLSPVQKSAKDKSSASRPVRGAKSKAYKKQVWLNGAVEEPPADSENDAVNPLLSQSQASKKRSTQAATTQDTQATKKKKVAHPAAEDDSAMLETDQKSTESARRRPHETNSRNAACLAPEVDASRFFDADLDSSEDSAGNGSGQEDEDSEGDGDGDFDADDGDLEYMDEAELSKTLDDERPQWSNSPVNEQDDDINEPAVDPPSPPRPNREEPLSGSEDSDSDVGLRAGLSSLKAAQRARPLPPPAAAASRSSDSDVVLHAGISSLKRARPLPPPAVTASHSRAPANVPHLDLSQAAAKSYDNGKAKEKSVLKPTQGSRRQAKRAANEVPTWNPLYLPPTLTSTSTRPPAPPPVSSSPPRSHPRSSSSPPQVSPYKVTTNKKNGASFRGQKDAVDRLLHLGHDYLMGKLFRGDVYADADLKAALAKASLVQAAAHLDDPKLAAMLEEEATLRALINGIVSRVPNARSAAKVFSDKLMHSGYGVTEDTLTRATALKSGMTFIYPLKPSTTDPVTGERVPGQPDKKKPFSHPAVAKTATFLFKRPKGQASLGERLYDLFPINDNGNREATPALVALASTALYSSLDDYSITPYTRTEFDSGRVEHAYRTNIKLLTAFRTKQSQRYHTTMEMIFRVAAGDQRPDNAPPSTLEKDTLDGVDLDD
ncbi:hypothetical protein GGX14DRAFT_399747 [Mycena pura]|uniref:DUF6532 domain-containing protein n=1 Tax=Mycena pura TaxID=153505 RepID=A0AAD6Y518_9AGAR|nr:hypothetical protein GGX14DRAFT_399747 [Mycena pura]